MVESKLYDQKVDLNWNSQATTENAPVKGVVFLNHRPDIQEKSTGTGTVPDLNASTVTDPNASNITDLNAGKTTDPNEITSIDLMGDKGSDPTLPTDLLSINTDKEK